MWSACHALPSNVCLASLSKYAFMPLAPNLGARASILERLLASQLSLPRSIDLHKGQRIVRVASLSRYAFMPLAPNLGAVSRSSCPCPCQWPCTSKHECRLWTVRQPPCGLSKCKPVQMCHHALGINLVASASFHKFLLASHLSLPLSMDR